MNSEQREQYQQLYTERAIVNGEWFLFLSGKGGRPDWIPKGARSRAEWEAAYLRRLLPIVARMRERARRGSLAGFDAVTGSALDPAHAVLVFPCDRNGDLTDEGARQFAALLRAMDTPPRAEAAKKSNV